MADFTFPATGSTKWLMENEFTWGIPPFANMEIDWARGKGICRWGKHCTGTISSVKVSAARNSFTASFSITHAHRGVRSQILSGTMTVTVKDAGGRVAVKIFGLPDWKDNTTFEAQKVKTPIPYSSKGGKHFDVIITTGNAAKAVGVATFGNLYARDRDRHVEVMYPLLTVGAGLTAGVTLYSSTTFSDVRLKHPCNDWSGSDVSLMNGFGINAIVGFNTNLIEVRRHNARLFLAETAGLGIGADLSATYMTGQIGKLGPKMQERYY